MKLDRTSERREGQCEEANRNRRRPTRPRVSDSFLWRQPISDRRRMQSFFKSICLGLVPHINVEEILRVISPEDLGLDQSTSPATERT